MPVRVTVSPLEASIITQVKQYLLSRSAEMRTKKAEDPDAAVEDGVDMMADAICLGINEAFKGPAFAAMMAPINDTNVAAVIPIGTTLIPPIVLAQTAPSVPNPIGGI